MRAGPLAGFLAFMEPKESRHESRLAGMTARPTSRIIPVRKWAILCHRWMGVTFCVLFSMWFVSGIVMMYWDYPDVGSEERLGRSPALDGSQIRITPEEAAARLQLAKPSQMRIAMLDGRPVYRIFAGREQAAVYADDGQPVVELEPPMALRIASAWVGQPASAAKFEGFNTEEDQWTVSGSFRDLRPLLKYSWPDGQEVYVSQVTGEVVQHTTRGSRIGAYFGAIPHWLYFTPLRKDGALWNKVVILSSGIGTLAAILGLLAGMLMFSPSKRYHFPEGSSSIPYAGQKRWHTMLGLVFGLTACTWVFSGMLSMEPFEWLSSRADAVVAGALRGGPLRLARFAPKLPREALAEVASALKVKELELTTFAGEPAYLARESPRRSRVIPVRGAPALEFDRTRIVELIAKSSLPRGLAEVRVVTDYEAYYLDRHHQRPLPVLFVRLNDSQDSMYYIDPSTARVVLGYTTHSRWNRWLYHGLHSIDLPWLYRHRPAWDILVLALMLGGTALCVTSLVIGWRRLRRKVTGRHVTYNRTATPVQ